MFTTYLVVLATSLALTFPQAQSQDVRAEAEKLAQSGNYAEALKRYQAIAAANPEDIPARLWIGRLQMRLGEPRRAAAVFESIVATNPQNIEALVGLGLAQLAAGRMREAGDALNRAEALGADRVDVLEAQGRFHAADGRPTLSLAYFARATALEPTNAAIVQAAAAVRAGRAHRIELGYDLQHFNVREDDTHTGTIEVNARLSDSFRIFAKGQTHRAFDENENRGGGGIEWMPRHDVWIRAGAMAGSDTVDLPEVDVFGSVLRTGKRAHVGFDLRFVDFTGAQLWIGGPTLAFDLTPRSTAYFEYHYGNADTDFGLSENSSNVTLGFETRVGKRASALVEYRHGIDRLEWITVDRLGATDANTFSAGLGFDITPLVTLGGRYDYQSRSDDVSVQRGTGRLIFRF
jgi:tetratricopeptide (TPR) repeat protein